MRISEIEYRKRKEELARPILDLTLNDAVIADVVKRYALGQIVTKEEALYQMVIQLAEIKREWLVKYDFPKPTVPLIHCSRCGGKKSLEEWNSETLVFESVPCPNCA